jgi:charged multivesicular body protein 5
MNRIFGSKKDTKPVQPVKQEKEKEPEVKVPAPDLVEQSKKLEARVQELNANITNIDNELKEQYPKLKKAKGSQQHYYKQKVLTLMKKRKMYQQQVDNILNQQFSLDQVAFTKENIQHTIDTTKALKEATVAQKEAMKNLNIDEIEDLRDEMDDMVWESNQINDMLNRDYACDVDEADLDAELQELDDGMFMDMMDNKQENKQEVKQDHYSQMLAPNKN